MPSCNSFFFRSYFNDPATTEIYTLSLHDALPISTWTETSSYVLWWLPTHSTATTQPMRTSSGPPSGSESKSDRKSTRLNSSHRCISYAVFCLKKKKKITKLIQQFDAVLG